MSANDIRAGGAFVELFTKNERLNAGLKAAQSKLKSFAIGATAIGAAFSGLAGGVLTPLRSMAEDAAKMGDGLRDMSIRTGVSTIRD